MRPTKRTTLAAVAVTLALSGCFMEVEGDSVTITRDIGTFVGVPAAYQTPEVVALASGLNVFTIDIGSQDFVVAKKDFGPLTLNGTLNVNQAVVAIVGGASGGRTLANLQTLELWQLSDPNCTGAQCQETLLAQYTRPPAGAPDPGQVALTGTGANALVLVQNGRFTLQIRATGQIPTEDWPARVTLDGHLKDRATWP